MDDNDTKTSSEIETRHNLNEEGLKVALEVNEALSRKGKSFKSYKNFAAESLRNSKFDVLPKDITNQTSFQSANIYSNNDQLTLFNNKKNSQETNRVNNEIIATSTDQALPINLQNSNANVIESSSNSDNININGAIEDKKSTPENNSQQQGKDVTAIPGQSISEQTTLYSSDEEFTTHATPPVTFYHTTFEPEEFSEEYRGLKAESLTEIEHRDKFIEYNRPLIKSTTTKPTAASTRRTLAPLNSLKQTTAKIEGNALDLHESETTTQRTFLKTQPKEKRNYRHFKTTTEKNINEMNEYGSGDETIVEDSSAPTTRRPLSRLIRYGTTTHSTNDLEDDHREIETTTFRNLKRTRSTILPTRHTFGVNRSKFSTFKGGTRDIQNTLADSKIATTRSFFPTRRALGSLSRLTQRQSPQIHKDAIKLDDDVAISTTEKYDSTLNDVPTTTKRTFTAGKIFEDTISRPEIDNLREEEEYEKASSEDVITDKNAPSENIYEIEDKSETRFTTKEVLLKEAVVTTDSSESDYEKPTATVDDSTYSIILTTPDIDQETMKPEVNINSLATDENFSFLNEDSTSSKLPIETTDSTTDYFAHTSDLSITTEFALTIDTEPISNEAMVTAQDSSSSSILMQESLPPSREYKESSTDSAVESNDEIIVLSEHPPFRGTNESTRTQSPLSTRKLLGGFQQTSTSRPTAKKIKIEAFENDYADQKVVLANKPTLSPRTLNKSLNRSTLFTNRKVTTKAENKNANSTLDERGEATEHLTPSVRRLNVLNRLTPAKGLAKSKDNKYKDYKSSIESITTESPFSRKKPIRNFERPSVLPKLLSSFVVHKPSDHNHKNNANNKTDEKIYNKIVLPTTHLVNGTNHPTTSYPEITTVDVAEESESAAAIGHEITSIESDNKFSSFPSETNPTTTKRYNEEDTTESQQKPTNKIQIENFLLARKMLSEKTEIDPAQATTDPIINVNNLTTSSDFYESYTERAVEFEQITDTLEAVLATAKAIEAEDDRETLTSKTTTPETPYARVIEEKRQRNPETNIVSIEDEGKEQRQDPSLATLGTPAKQFESDDKKVTKLLPIMSHTTDIPESTTTVPSTLFKHDIDDSAETTTSTDFPTVTDSINDGEDTYLLIENDFSTFSPETSKQPTFTTDAPLAEHNNMEDATTKRTFKNFNKYKTFSKSPKPLYKPESEDHLKKPISQFSNTGKNRTLFNRFQPQNKTFVETTERIAQNFSNESIRSAQPTPRLNSPQNKRPFFRPQPTDTEEENEEKEEDQTDENFDSIEYEKEYQLDEDKPSLATEELALKETSSPFLSLRNRYHSLKTQDNDSQKNLSNERRNNLLTSRFKTNNTYKMFASKSSAHTEDEDQTNAIYQSTNTFRFGTKRSNSTVANYLNKIKTNLSQIVTNTAPSHPNHLNEVKLKIDSDKVNDEDTSNRQEFSYSHKSLDNDFNLNVYKGDDNDSKRRFQKYQFQRRTTTTTSTTSTAATPIEAEEDRVAAKSQVNLNDAYDSERITSTNIPETSAPITTESPSSPATPLPRRIKVLKLKRPVVSNINNTNVTVKATAISATNSNVNHTDTQIIAKLSSSEVESQISQIETLTETAITKTQTPLPPQTASPKPKQIRKVIRKIIRPINRTADVTSETTDVTTDESSTASAVRQYANRYGFHRSTKLKLEKEEKANEEQTLQSIVDKIELLDKRNQAIYRGRNKFINTATEATRSAHYGGLRHTTNGPQPPTTTTKPKEDYDEYATDDEYDSLGEAEEGEEIIIKTSTSRPTETTTKLAVESASTLEVELEDTTLSGRSSEHNLTKTEETTELRVSDNVTGSDDPLLKLRNKVKQDLAKVEEVEGIINTRLKNPKTTSEEEETETEDPLVKLRNKVKQDLTKAQSNEGVLSNRLKLNKNELEAKNNDDPLLKLRNKVKQESTKSNEQEGVVSVKFKKLLETKNATSPLNYKVDDSEIETTSTNDDLNLQKIRDKVQANLVKSDQDKGVVNSRLKKLLSEKKNTTVLFSNSGEEQTEQQGTKDETTTEIKIISGDEEILDESKHFIPRKPFVPKSKPRPENNDIKTKAAIEIITTTSAPRERPTFRRKLVAKRPYTPNKPLLSSFSTSTTRAPELKGRNKYARQQFHKNDPSQTGSRYAGQSFVRTDSRFNKLNTVNRFKIEGSARGQNGEEDDEYDDEAENEEVDEEEEEEFAEEEQEEEDIKPIQIFNPNFARPPASQTTILRKPVLSKDNAKEDTEADEEEEDDGDDEDELEEDNNEEYSPENETSSSRPTTYKPKINRAPPGARPGLNNKNSFTPSRVSNTPYRPGAFAATTNGNKPNSFGSSLKSTSKPRVINRPLGVAVPNLTIKPVANDFERTTALTPTKPAPFINPNTRAYERKYTGPTTESPIDTIADNNPLIEDLNIEAINARNKKIFDINSKKHTTLKPKVNLPLAIQNENTQNQQQQQKNTEYENDSYDHPSSVDGFVTTTSKSITNTQTEQQEHIQSTTLDNTINGTQNTDDANPSNANNLNEISSQDGFTTTPSPSTTLLHIFTLSDAEHTTQNPLDDGYQVVPRLIVERTQPKHKVVEINRIVEVNSKEEKLRRKSKANTIVPIEGSQTFKVETLPHVEQLGEISVVKYVHQVDGSDIIIEGRSTVTDYTPTEPTFAGSSQPIRYSLPDETVQQRNGKALLPEVIREAAETSTISLEGLFETARKGKVLNTVDETDDNNKETNSVAENSTAKPNNLDSNASPITVKPTERRTEFSDIFPSIAFDEAKINLEISSEETESKNSTNSSATSVTSEQISTTTTRTTLAPETLKQESSTAAAPEDTKATTVPTALLPQYVRPIVPLLRPESNESSPLIISIANLDKVILSKVQKTVNGVDVEEGEQHQESQVQPKQENTEIPDSQTENPDIPTTTNTIPYYHSKPIVETQAQQNSTIHDSQAAFSQRLASVLKAPLVNYLSQNEKPISKVTNVTHNPLEKTHQVTQTELYTINEGNVGSTTSSAIGSKISETVSFSSETTVVRRKQPRKAKSKKFSPLTTNASASES